MTKLGHFFWLQPTEIVATDFSYQMFASVWSFMVNHPTWHTTLWTNRGFSGPLFYACKDLGLNTCPIHRIDNQLNISSEVNYWKWSAIRNEGGMVMDISDTITLGSFDDIYDDADKLTWSYYWPATRMTSMGNGWLCINKPGSDIAIAILDEMTAPEHSNAMGRWEQRSLSTRLP